MSEAEGNWRMETFNSQKRNYKKREWNSKEVGTKIESERKKAHDVRD